MRRRDGLLIVFGLVALNAALAALMIWPVWAGIGWIIGLFSLLLYAALFVWPDDAGGRETT